MDYEVVRELGRGGMGAVYVARHRTLGREVALKVLLADWIGEEDLSRFQTEAEAVARLRHPGIVTIHEFGQHQGKPFLIMDLVPGRALDAVLAADGPRAPQAAAALVRDLARAVAHAHEHGVVHRDIKPANVLVTPDGRPVLTDFGLAVNLSQTRERLTRSGQMVGTPAFMSPEQADGKGRDVGEAADVYALGATLFALLTGSPPFEAPTVLGLAYLVLETPADPPSARRPGVPSELDAICLQCLNKAPADRYPTATALADDLERFLRGDAVQATGQALGRKQRTLATGLVAALVGLVLFTAAGLALVASAALEPTAGERALVGIAALERGELATARAELAAIPADAKEREVRVLRGGLLALEGDPEAALPLLPDRYDEAFPAVRRWRCAALVRLDGLTRAQGKLLLAALPEGDLDLEQRLGKVRALVAVRDLERALEAWPTVAEAPAAVRWSLLVPWLEQLLPAQPEAALTLVAGLENPPAAISELAPRLSRSLDSNVPSEAVRRTSGVPELLPLLLRLWTALAPGTLPQELTLRLADLVRDYSSRLNHTFLDLCMALSLARPRSPDVHRALITCFGERRQIIKELDRPDAFDPIREVIRFATPENRLPAVLSLCEHLEDEARGDPGAARELLDLADRHLKDPALAEHRAVFYSFRGRAHYGLNDLEPALGDYERSLALQPADHEIMMERLVVLDRLGRGDPEEILTKATIYLNGVVALSAKGESAMRLAYEAALRLDDLPRARDCLERVLIREKRRLPGWRARLALLYLEAGERAQAQTQLELAARAFPKAYPRRHPRLGARLAQVARAFAQGEAGSDEALEGLVKDLDAQRVQAPNRFHP